MEGGRDIDAEPPSANGDDIREVEMIARDLRYGCSGTVESKCRGSGSILSKESDMVSLPSIALIYTPIMHLSLYIAIQATPQKGGFPILVPVALSSDLVLLASLQRGPLCSDPATFPVVAIVLHPLP